MTVLYEDKRIILDDDAITIMDYYFPKGARRIAYRDLLAFQEHTMGMGMFSGRWRIWGTPDLARWFNLDPARPRKNRAITLETGGFFEPVITPDNPQAVLDILRLKVSPTGTRFGGQYNLGMGMGMGQSGQGQYEQGNRGMGMGQSGQGQYGQGGMGMGMGQPGQGQGQIYGSGGSQGTGGQLSGSTTKTGSGSSSSTP